MRASATAEGCEGIRGIGREKERPREREREREGDSFYQSCLTAQKDTKSTIKVGGRAQSCRSTVNCTK